MLPEETPHLFIPSATDISTMHTALQETHFHRRKGNFTRKKRARDRLALPVCHCFL